MELPIVQPHDLLAFHASHISPLSDIAVPPNADEGALYPENHVHQDEYSELEEENLGTYPDGQPRTLTDAQIAMFRHSEIQRLLRERRRRREASSSCYSSPPSSRRASPERDRNGTGPGQRGGHIAAHAASGASSKSYASAATRKVWREEEDVDGLGEGAKRQNRRDMATRRLETLKEKGTACGSTNHTQKVKLDVTEHDPYTARRYARELDGMENSVAGQDAGLDYG